ncbi:MAG: DUF2219 family protein [Brevundimonas sp.]|nr:MAG: DUF2219 family protein [Brevundimonas sp.]
MAKAAATTRVRASSCPSISAPGAREPGPGVHVRSSVTGESRWRPGPDRAGFKTLTGRGEPLVGLKPSILGLIVSVACAAPAVVSAQVAVSDPWRVTPERPRTVSDLIVQLNERQPFDDLEPDLDIADRWAVDAPRDQRATWAASTREVRFAGAGFDDSLRLRTAGRLRRADGGPLPPTSLDGAALETEHYDVTYTRGWTGALGQTENGLDVTLTPHVGVGVGSRGGVTEAGATLKIGPDLDNLVPDGGERFGNRARWYLYAAGSGRAVGYNFARTRDGDFARSGMSHDAGNFLGDASIGVAMRRGAVQSSVGLVYREIETEGFNAGAGVDTDVSEGLIAFQLSIKPE